MDFMWISFAFPRLQVDFQTLATQESFRLPCFTDYALKTFPQLIWKAACVLLSGVEAPNQCERQKHTSKATKASKSAFEGKARERCRTFSRAVDTPFFLKNASTYNKQTNHRGTKKG